MGESQSHKGIWGYQEMLSQIGVASNEEVIGMGVGIFLSLTTTACVRSVAISMKDGPAAEQQLEFMRGSDVHTGVINVNRELIVKHLESIC